MEKPDVPCPVPVTLRYQPDFNEQSRSPYPRPEANNRPEALSRRDPLNNPSDRRREPVPPDFVDSDTSTRLQFQGAVRTRRLRGLSILAQSNGAGSSRLRHNAAERVTVPLNNTTDMKLDHDNLPLAALPVPFPVAFSSSQYSGLSSANLPQTMVDAFASSTSGGIARCLSGPDITAHVHAEATLFEADAILHENEPDDTEVARMLQPHTSFETLAVLDSAGKVNNLVRKRPIEDDGSDLHGRDMQSASSSALSDLDIAQPQYPSGVNGVPVDIARPGHLQTGIDFADGRETLASPNASASPPPLFPCDISETSCHNNSLTASLTSQVRKADSNLINELELKQSFSDEHRNVESFNWASSLRL